MSALVPSSPALTAVAFAGQVAALLPSAGPPLGAVAYELAGEARWFGAYRGPLFVLNTMLASIPLALAVVVFRRGARPSVLWWAAAALFLLFLPNAAYVITDGVHLLADIRHVESDLALATIYIPGYLAFFAAGFTCYVLALRRVEGYVRHRWPGVPWWAVWCALQALVGVGVYLGRVTRVHSWHVVTRPDVVLDGLASLGRPVPFAVLLFTIAVVGVAALLWRVVVDAAIDRSTRVAHRALDWIALDLRP